MGYSVGAAYIAALQRSVGAQSVILRVSRGFGEPACSFGDRNAILSRARHPALFYWFEYTISFLFGGSSHIATGVT